MFLDITRYSWQSYKKELLALVTLALPMLLSQIAQVGAGFADTVMAGQVSPADLSAVGLGSSLLITVYITLMGVMTALNPLIAQAYGKGSRSSSPQDKTDIGKLGRQGLWYGAVLGVLGTFVIWGASMAFDGYGNLDSKTLAITKLYLWFAGFAMPAMMIHRALHAYASSLGKPKVIMIVSWLCLAVNVGLNWVFIYGKFGMPKLDGAGCGLATALAFWVNAGVLGLYIAKDRYFTEFGLFDRFELPDPKQLWAFTKLGVPIGLSFFIEVSLFTCIIFLVAKLDGDTTTLIAAQQIVISLTSLIFMLPQSMGIACTVQVGFNLGKNNPHKARYVCGVALLSGMVVSLVTASILVVFRQELGAVYTDDSAVIAVASGLLLFAAAFQLVDAVQCIASYALRGYKLTKIPMLIHAVAFWGCGLLPGYALAFWGDMGIYGFWLALVMSLSVAAVFLLWYLQKHSQHFIKQGKRQS